MEPVGGLDVSASFTAFIVTWSVSIRPGSYGDALVQVFYVTITLVHHTGFSGGQVWGSQPNRTIFGMRWSGI